MSNKARMPILRKKKYNEYISIIIPAIQYDGLLSIAIMIIAVIVNEKLFVSEKVYLFPFVSLMFVIVMGLNGGYNKKYESDFKQIVFRIMLLLALLFNVFVLFQVFSSYEMIKFFIISKFCISLIITNARNDSLEKRNKEGLLIFRKY